VVLLSSCARPAALLRSSQADVITVTSDIQQTSREELFQSAWITDRLECKGDNLDSADTPCWTQQGPFPPSPIPKTTPFSARGRRYRTQKSYANRLRANLRAVGGNHGQEKEEVKVQSRGEELHWAKQVKEQQRVVDRNDNPRERQYLEGTTRDSQGRTQGYLSKPRREGEGEGEGACWNL